MLYEYLSGEVEAWHIAPDCKELLDDKVRFIRGTVTEIDLDGRVVTIAGRAEPVSYDVLVVAPGAVTNYAGVEGAEQFSLPFRALNDANRLRRRMTEALDHVQPDAAPQDMPAARSHLRSSEEAPAASSCQPRWPTFCATRLSAARSTASRAC